MRIKIHPFPPVPKRVKGFPLHLDNSAEASVNSEIMISQQTNLIDKRLPCCCKSNLTTLVVLGLISFFGNIAFCVLELLQKDVLFFILGLFFMFNSVILIIGARVSSSSVILLWMIFAITQVDNFQKATLSNFIKEFEQTF